MKTKVKMRTKKKKTMTTTRHSRRVNSRTRKPLVLEFAVRKEAEVASTDNPLIRKRFEDALKKLRADPEVRWARRIR